MVMGNVLFEVIFSSTSIDKHHTCHKFTKESLFCPQNIHSIRPAWPGGWGEHYMTDFRRVAQASVTELNLKCQTLAPVIAPAGHQSLLKNPKRQLEKGVLWQKSLCFNWLVWARKPTKYWEAKSLPSGSWLQENLQVPSKCTSCIPVVWEDESLMQVVKFSFEFERCRSVFSSTGQGFKPC